MVDPVDGVIWLDDMIRSSMFGIIETNPYWANKYFRPVDHNVSHANFTKSLAMQLVKNWWLGPQGSQRDSSEGTVHCHNSPEDRGRTLQPLRTLSDRKRVQRKCVVCSRVRNIQRKT